MPWASYAQRLFALTPAGRKAGFTDEKVAQWDRETAFDTLPMKAPKRESAAQSKSHRD